MVLAAPVIIKSPKLFRIDEVNSCVYVRVQARKKFSAKIVLRTKLPFCTVNFKFCRWKVVAKRKV